MTEDNKWAPFYIAGILLFSYGAGTAFGIAGIYMAVGATMTMGAFGHFLLMRIAALTSAFNKGKEQ